MYIDGYLGNNDQDEVYMKPNYVLINCCVQTEAQTE